MTLDTYAAAMYQERALNHRNLEQARLVHDAAPAIMRSGDGDNPANDQARPGWRDRIMIALLHRRSAFQQSMAAH